jgi:hypothetical protein
VANGLRYRRVGESTQETGNCYRSEPAPKNAEPTTRPVHALLGRI